MIKTGITAGEALERLRDFGIYVFRRFEDDRLMRVAASLSYTSLLAIVPLVAISFAVLAGFPVFGGLRAQVQSYVVNNFLPVDQDAALDYLNSFVINTGSLTAIGIVGLAVTAILLLHTVENAFHIIFREESQRSLASRVLVYWACLTIGPFLLGGSISLSTLLFAVAELPVFSEHVQIAGMLRYGLPNLLAFVALWLFYAVIPTRPIRFRDAFIGAVTAAILFAALRLGFGAYVVDGSLRTIYGAAAAVPVFLVWMYLSGAAVLFGAEITAALDEWGRNGWRDPGRDGIGDVARGERIRVALTLLSLLWRRHQGRGGGLTSRTMRRRLDRGGHLLDATLQRLTGARIVAHDVHDRWLLARDLDRITLYDLCRALEVFSPAPSMEGGIGDEAPWQATVGACLERAEHGRRDSLDLTVAALLDQQPPNEQSPGREAGALRDASEKDVSNLPIS